MDPNTLVERLRRFPGTDAIPHLDSFDVRDDLHLDGAASALLQRFHAANDAGALSLLYELCHRRLAEIARHITARFALAIDPDDLVAAFVTRIFTDVRRPQPVVRHFLGLAHTAMRNDALNQVRQHERARRRLLQVDAGPQPVDPAEAVDARERAARLRRLSLLIVALARECFHGLKQRDRLALLARDVERCSYEDLARRLELPANQVGSVLRRARLRFAERLSRALAAREELEEREP